MLGRTSSESAIHARDATFSAGWLGDEPDLLDLGNLGEALHSIGYTPGLSLVVNIRHPFEPRAELMDALLAAPKGVFLRAVIPYARQWAWFEQGDEVDEVILDEVAYIDCGDYLQMAGIPFRLVHSSMSVTERIRLANRNTALLLEYGNAVRQWRKSERLAEISRTTFYGQLSGGDVPQALADLSCIWLSFMPSHDRPGSLSAVLANLANAGLDLAYIRSLQTLQGRHVFHTAFRIGSDDPDLQEVLAVANKEGTRMRLLARFSVEVLSDAPMATVEPIWAEDV